MDSWGQIPLGFISDQGKKFMLSAALCSCCYPGDEKVQLFLPRETWLLTAQLSVTELFPALHLDCEDTMEEERV